MKMKNYYNGYRDFLNIQNNLCPHMMPSSIKATIDLGPLKRKGQKAKNSAYYISALSKAMKKNPEVNSGFMRTGWFFKKPTIIRYPEVHATLSVDKTLGDIRFPYSYVFPKSDKLHLNEINERLEFLIKSEVTDIPEFKQLNDFAKFPRFFRKFFMTRTTFSPEKLMKKVGTFNITNISKWDLDFAMAPCARLLVAFGRPKDNILPITYNFNHIIVDGAQIGEFHHDFKELLENPEF